MIEKSMQEILIARFPALVDDATKIDVRPEWIKFIYQFCERVEALDFDLTRMRLHDIYEDRGRIVLDYDTLPEWLGRPSVPPRIKLKLRHFAEEIALESQLEGKDDE
ncbi:hypothetical protein CN140_01520 [Sinorhizobium meliloti]|uniref:hypothetical protein n=1 Tax=Rhizobium meliloti TaxID=382 RepID=UPI000FDA9023|nr:hypothetical protein [Sinorhizobium meliloti]RVL87637.1 hypothetical protein CN140_01520 [Sinorhizobium meliloti]